MGREWLQATIAEEDQAATLRKSMITNLVLLETHIALLPKLKD